MNIFNAFYKMILDALFPITKTDAEILSCAPEQAFDILPRAPKPPIPDSYSIFAYKNELVKKLIWNIKYKKSEKAVKIGGYALYKKLIELANAGIIKKIPSNDQTNSSQIILIPIPVSNRRRRERGYNQCEILLNEIKRLDDENRFAIRKDLLERIHHLDRQTLKDRNERLAAKGIFAVNENGADKTILHKTPIIVIDDVITTGSTMQESISTMKAAGFENVTGLSLAH